MYEIYRRYIGDTLKKRMDILEIDAATLAEMAFMDAEVVKNIVNNKIPYEKIDQFDMALISSALHCNEQYFEYPDTHNDFLGKVIDKEKDSDASKKAKIKIQDFLNDFIYVNKIMSENSPKNSYI